MYKPVCLFLAAVIALVSTGAAIAAPAPGAIVSTPIKAPARELTPPKTVRSLVKLDAKSITIEELFKSAGLGGAVWSRDGKSIFVMTNKGGRMNLWRQSLDGDEAEQIQQSDQVQEAPTLAGDCVIYQSDVDGSLIYDLFSAPTDGGEAENLTGTEDISEAWPVASEQGDRIAFSIRRKEAPSYDIAVMDIESGEIRKLTDEKVDGVQWQVASLSRDGRFLVANRFDWSFTVGEGYLIDVKSGETRRLTPEGVYGHVGDISGDNRHISLSIVSEDGVSQAALMDVETGDLVYPMRGEWEQRVGRFSPDGGTMLFVSNVDGRDEVMAFDIAKQKSWKLNLPEGVNSDGPYLMTLPEFSPQGDKILFKHASGSEPEDFWIYDLKTERAKRVTAFAGVEDGRLPKTTLVRYRSFDGTVISAFLWMPYNLKRDGSAPAVIRPHGGPTGQTRDAFSSHAALLASNGYVVLAPNFRGSTGYGRNFLEANQMDLGGGDLKDVVAGAEFLIETDYVDPERIGINGGSYGGYMTLMAIGKTPEVWAAAVEEFGIVNWRTMWGHGAPQNRRYLEGLMGTPTENPDAYDRSSPLTYLPQAKAPLLVLHGENDPIVPLLEAQQVVELMEQHGKVVEAHFYPGEGHGIAKVENRKNALRRMRDWFDAHLKKD